MGRFVVRAVKNRSRVKRVRPIHRGLLIRQVPEEQDKPLVRISLTVKVKRGRFRREDLAGPHREVMADHVSVALVSVGPVSAVRKRTDLVIDKSAGRMPLIAVSSLQADPELGASGRTPFVGRSRN